MQQNGKNGGDMKIISPVKASSKKLGLSNYNTVEKVVGSMPKNNGNNNKLNGLSLGGINKLDLKIKNK